VAYESPEDAALVADSVGIALLVVLDTLTPAERLAFVLHDVFAVPFDQIAAIVDRTPDAARQLASRARRRVQSGATTATADAATHRRLVDAFLRAARHGDFAALLVVLHEDVVFRVHVDGMAPVSTTGATAVARQVLCTAPRFIELARPVLVGGRAGAIAGTVAEPAAIMGFDVVDGRIAAIDIMVNRARMPR
jgi:RNA polymerase sigma-70 factor (ECF subfamily)